MSPGWPFDDSEETEVESRWAVPEPARSTATNIEIKARVSDLARLRAVVEPMADTKAEVLDQVDVFFAAPAGRLKLRILDE